MKVTNEKLIGLWHLFSKFGTEKTNVKFHFIIAKNKRLIESDIHLLKEASEPLEKYLEYDLKRKNSCEVFAKKGEDDKPVVLNNRYVIDEEKKEEFDKEIEKLQEEYKETIKEQEKREEDYLALLKEETDVSFNLIPLSIMPENTLGMDVELLFDLIEE